MKTTNQIPLVMALALSGIEKGDFQISILCKKDLHCPQNSFAVIDYIQHGGRVIFDYKGLSKPNKQKLEDILSQIKEDGTERFSTHVLERKETGAEEDKLKLYQSWDKGAKNTVIDFTFDLPEKGKKSGHALLVDKPSDHCFMIGFENAGADIGSVVRGEHSPFGKGNKTTWSGEKKLDDPEYLLSQYQKNIETPKKYNGMKVTLADENFDEVLLPFKDFKNHPKKTCQIDEKIYNHFPNHAKEGGKDLSAYIDKTQEKIANKKHQKNMTVISLLILAGLMVPVLVVHPLAAMLLGCYGMLFLLGSNRKELSKISKSLTLKNFTVSIVIAMAISLIVVPSVL